MAAYAKTHKCERELQMNMKHGGGLGGFAHIRSRSKSQVMQMNHNLKEINEDMDNGFVNY